MNRQQKRQADRKANKEKTKTYNLTKHQLKGFAQKEVAEEMQKYRELIEVEAISKAMVLFLTIPMEVLMDHYWPRSYQKKIPEFTSYVLEYYSKWENGELDMEKLQEDLWTYGGVRFEYHDKEE